MIDKPMKERRGVALAVSGLLAGVVVNAGKLLLNGLLLRDEWEAAMRSLSRPPIGTTAIVWLNVMGFTLGIGMMYTYRALLARFSSPYEAAIAAGLLSWLMAYALGFGWSFAMGVFSGTIYFSTLVWSLFEFPLACLAGAWLDRRHRA